MSVDYTQDVLEGMADDPTPRTVNDRELIAQAINKTAEQHRGRVHASTLREHIPANVNPAYIGATVNRLARRGLLVATGHYAPNGGTASRNKSKRSPVWKRMRPITPEDIAVPERTTTPEETS